MISIVTSYYNRKKLFENTLMTIDNSKVKDFEFIVVDDGSDDPQRIEDLQKKYPFLRIIRLEKKDKWYVNPCIPFNIGIREAKGDIIILQNPECLHANDVLSYINDNINNSNYLTISAYGLDSSINEGILNYAHKTNSLSGLIKSLPQRSIYGNVSLGWYNHLKHRPGYYHFCSAITRENMGKLNGFDERFFNGIGYDDDEFLARVRFLGLQPTIVEDVSVIHQYHKSVWNEMNEKNKLVVRNTNLFNYVTMTERNYHAPNKTELWSGN